MHPLQYQLEVAVAEDKQPQVVVSDKNPLHYVGKKKSESLEKSSIKGVIERKDFLLETVKALKCCEPL